MSPPATAWPHGFERVPAEDWTRDPISDLALGYDAVTRHAWYANLVPTVQEVAAALPRGGVVVDYSGGTGALAKRLLEARDDVPLGVVDVDASAKFLRLALERFRDEPRLALRRLRWLPEAERLERLHEVLGKPLVERGVDVLACANAVHLYPDLDATFRSWTRVLRPGALVHVQSGNVARPDARGWIIDATVEAVSDAAREMARTDPRYAQYGAVLEDPQRMAAYEALRRRFFLPARPLERYTAALEDAGLRVERVTHRPVEARRDEWTEFLHVYHEGVLPWVGGSERVGDPAPSEDALADRRRLIRAALQHVLGGAATFQAEWTYLTCTWEG